MRCIIEEKVKKIEKLETGHNHLRKEFDQYVKSDKLRENRLNIGIEKIAELKRTMNYNMSKVEESLEISLDKINEEFQNIKMEFTKIRGIYNIYI